MSNRPLVLFDNWLDISSTSSASSLPQYPSSNAVTPFTYDRWRYASSVTHNQFTMDLGAPRNPDAVGIIISGIASGFLSVEASIDNDDWTPVQTWPLTGDGVYLFPFVSALTWQYWRLWITVSGINAPTVSVANVMLGRVLEFEKPLIRTHAPLPLNRVTNYKTNLSGTGQFLGRSISREGVSTTVDAPPMSKAFARGAFQDFVKAARVVPYYFSWNHSLNPGDVGYVWTDEDIRTAYAGDGSLMSASWEMRGIV